MKWIISCVLCIAIQNVDAQKVQAGLMLGINTTFQNFSSTKLSFETESKLGYNLIAFGRVNVANVLIQPEIGYYNNRASFVFDPSGSNIDATIGIGQFYSSMMLGYKLGTIRVLLGPMFYRELSQSENKTVIENLSIESVNNGQNKWGAQVGLGLNIGRHWQVDARFQKMLNSFNFKAIVDSESEVMNGTQSNLSFFLGYSLF